MDTEPQLPPEQTPTAEPTPASRWTFHPFAVGIGIGLVLVALVATATLLLARTAPSGELLLDSQPSGAAVSIDGQRRGQTPLRITADPRGVSYRVALALDGYGSLEQLVDVPPGARQQLSLTLEPLLAELALDSTPIGALVELDGRSVGHTPMNLQDLSAGRYSLTYKLTGHALWSGVVELGPGASERRAIRLEALPASLEVVTDMPGVKVFIEDEPRGETPLTVAGLASGPYEIKLQSQGLKDWIGYLWLAPGESRRVVAALTAPEMVAWSPPTPMHGIAVIVENQDDARPQTGLDQASIVYEAMAEGGISRFMALYLEGDAPAIGPVRSARHYFVNWAREYDAALVHVGASPQGFEALRAARMVDLDEEPGSTAIWRMRERLAPHNAYARISGIRADLGGRVPTGKWGGLAFKDPEWRHSGMQAHQLTIDYGWKYRVAYSYQPETNDYRRFMAEAPHLDAQSGQQLHAATVIVMTVPSWIIDSEGRLDMALMGNGKADYFLDGVHIAGAWRRESLRDTTSYLDSAGKEMHFNPGPVWIQVVPATAQVEY